MKSEIESLVFCISVYVRHLQNVLQNSHERTAKGNGIGNIRSPLGSYIWHGVLMLLLGVFEKR
jgi:hypothetical protein